MLFIFVIDAWGIYTGFRVPNLRMPPEESLGSCSLGVSQVISVFHCRPRSFCTNGLRAALILSFSIAALYHNSNK